MHSQICCRTVSFLPLLQNPRSNASVSHFSAGTVRRRVSRSVRRHWGRQFCVSAKTVKESDTSVTTKAVQSADAVFGSALLLGVAFLWGSYAPAMKFIFSAPYPPLPSTLSFIKSTFATSVLTLNYLRLRSFTAVQESDISADVSYSLAAKGPLGKALLWKSGSLVWTALELGLWDACGTFAQTIGISLTSTTSAAFLLHSVTVFTPVLASFTGDVLEPIGMLGCGISLLGCACVSLAVTPEGGVVSIGSIGDGCILLAAFFYALNTVRLGALGQDFKPAQLAVGNSIVSFVCASLWILSDFTRVQDDVQLWPGWQEWLPWLVILWLALGPDALAPILRNKGQRILPPSRAQLLFASTPFWSALIAASVLQTETLSPGTWIGGGCILVGALLSSFQSDSSPPSSV